jgi:hypothetical protein
MAGKHGVPLPACEKGRLAPARAPHREISAKPRAVGAGTQRGEAEQVKATWWGRLLAERGRPAPAVDSLLAATALHHGLRLVSRNTADFEYPGLEVIDPWLA